MHVMYAYPQVFPHNFSQIGQISTLTLVTDRGFHLLFDLFKKFFNSYMLHIQQILFDKSAVIRWRTWQHYMDILKTEQHRFASQLEPWHINLDTFAVTLNDWDRSSYKFAKETLDSFGLELDIFFAYMSIPTVYYNVIGCETFNVGA